MLNLGSLKCKYVMKPSTSPGAAVNGAVIFYRLPSNPLSKRAPYVKTALVCHEYIIQNALTTQEIALCLQYSVCTTACGRNNRNCAVLSHLSCALIVTSIRRLTSSHFKCCIFTVTNSCLRSKQKLIKNEKYESFKIVSVSPGI